MADSSPLAHSPTLAANASGGEDGAELAKGTAVGDYVIDRFLGGGAMGEVYAGKHPVIGKRVAIKVLRKELASSPEAAERFIREARAVNQIEHENVVDVFAFGRLDDGRLYLVMDLVDGRSLRALLVNGPLPVGQALEILDVIADALDAAHARGVIHRDLKPDNIMLADAGSPGAPRKVMVLDFGIAKLISKANEADAGGAKTLTGAGTWLGTPGYMAPEQWSVDGAGPASDRYALGVIAFELLSGVPPFSATSAPAMMEQHFRTAVPSLSSKGAPDLPPAIDDVVAKALAKDPDARFATARAFVDALREAAGSTAVRARAAVAPPGVPRRPWVPAVAGAALLGGAVAVVLVTRREDAPRTSSHANVPPAGSVKANVRSTPAGARVKRRDTGEILGTTPFQLAAGPGETIALRIEKPGYLPTEPTLSTGPTAAEVDGPPFALAEVTQFQGTWRLASGDLRNFARRGDEVDISKLSDVNGTREFFKTYPFVFADRGVAFGGDDTVVDGRGPNEPSCHIRVHVEYHYDAGADTLEQARDKLKVDFTDGKCIVQTRDIETSQLTRAEAVSDLHEIDAPVGKPMLPTKSTATTKPTPKLTKKTLPLDPTANLTKASKASKKNPEPEFAQENTPNAPVDIGKKQAAKSDQQLEDSKRTAPVPKQTTGTYTQPSTQGAQQGQVPQVQAPAPAPQANEPPQQAQIRKK